MCMFQSRYPILRFRRETLRKLLPLVCECMEAYRQVNIFVED